MSEVREQLQDSPDVETAVRGLMTAAHQRASAIRLSLVCLIGSGGAVRAEVLDDAGINVEIYDSISAAGSMDIAACKLADEGESGEDQASTGRLSRSVIQIPASVGSVRFGRLVLEGRALSLDTADREVLGLMASHVTLTLHIEHLNRLLERQAETQSSTPDRLIAARDGGLYEARLGILGKLCATVVHETKQRFGSIAANGAAGIRWLNRDKPDIEEAIASFRSVVRDADQSGEIIRSVSALYRGSEISNRSFDINESIRGAIALIQSDISIYQIELKATLENQPLVISGDEVLINQMLVNLMVNAIEALKSVEDNVRKLSVRSWRESKRRVRIEIVDSGIGMTEQDKRASRKARKPGSTSFGLGLDFCRDVLQAHDATIELHQREPRGCIVGISLPI
jgi:signal transduction histidine kinase